MIQQNLRRWLKLFELRMAGRNPGKRKRSQLRVEPLEERCTPTANITNLRLDTDTGISSTDGITFLNQPILVGTASLG